MRIRCCQSLLGIALLCSSGCIVLTPQKVKWCWADWNSERQLNAQVEMLDHLPLTPLRVRMMRWGYNIGETAYPLPMSMGMDSGPGNSVSGPAGMSLEAAPQFPGAVPVQESPLEIVPPPAPPAEPNQPTGEQGPQGNPTADLSSPITRASYRVPAANSAWMFSGRNRAARSALR